MILAIILSLIGIYFVYKEIGKNWLDSINIFMTIFLCVSVIILGFLCSFVVSFVVSTSISDQETIMKYEEIVGTQYTTFVPNSNSHVAYITHDKNVKIVSTSKVNLEDVNANTLIVIYEAKKRYNPGSFLFRSEGIVERVYLVMRKVEE